jgi:hypothetical protein
VSRRNKRIGAVLALAAVVAVVLVLVLSNGSSTSDSSTTAPSYTGAATVQRRNLVATDTESGTLSYANPQTVYNRLSGTITWLPAAGRVIKPGQALFDVDNQPVLLMDGSKPAYRDLSASDTAGPDILELNRNLVELGYNPDGIEITDQWQAATTAGVEALQEAEGWTENGTLSLGQIVFLPGSQLVATVDGSVGSTGGGGSEAALSDPPSHDLFVSYSHDAPATTTGTTPTATGTTPTNTTTTGTTSTTSGTPTTDHSGSSDSAAVAKQLAVLKAELAAVKKELKAEAGSKSASSGSKPSTSGSTASPGSSQPSAGTGSGDSGDSGSGGTATEILQTTSTQLVVTVDLDASLQSEATLGERVTVEMPDGSVVDGKVTAVSPVAQSSDSADEGQGGGSGDNGSGSSTVPVTVTLDKRAKGAGLDQAAVSVNFTQSKAGHVLSIPVTALIATAGQQFAVQEVVAPYKLIPVDTGLFAAGYVQISGSGIYPGLQVTDSQG